MAKEPGGGETEAGPVRAKSRSRARMATSCRRRGISRSKLEAADPYLFFAYKFRDLSLETKLIVTLGYGFGDGHINKMLTQSLRGDSERRLLVIQRCADDECADKKKEVAKLLDISAAQAEQILVQSGSAKEFLETADLAAQLVVKFPPSTNTPF